MTPRKDGGHEESRLSVKKAQLCMQAMAMRGASILVSEVPTFLMVNAKADSQQLTL